MNLPERQMHRLKWRMASEEAKKNEGPLFEMGVVSLGAILIIAGLSQTPGIGR